MQLSPNLAHLFNLFLNMRGVATEDKTQIELKKNKDFQFPIIIKLVTKLIGIGLTHAKTLKSNHQ